MAQAKTEPTSGKKAEPATKRGGHAETGAKTLAMAGQVIERARKEMGMTRQRLGEALDFTAAQVAKIEKGAAQLPFEKFSKAVRTLRIPAKEAERLRATRAKAASMATAVSGRAKAAWDQLSETDARKVSRDMLELGGHLPGAGTSPTKDELVLFAVRVAKGDHRRFRALLSACGIELSAASRIISKTLQTKLTGKAKQPAARSKPPASKPRASKPRASKPRASKPRAGKPS